MYGKVQPHRDRRIREEDLKDPSIIDDAVYHVVNLLQTIYRIGEGKRQSRIVRRATEAEETTGAIECFHCHKIGHFARECSTKVTNTNSNKKNNTKRHRRTFKAGDFKRSGTSPCGQRLVQAIDTRSRDRIRRVTSANGLSKGIFVRGQISGRSATFKVDTGQRSFLIASRMLEDGEDWSATGKELNRRRISGPQDGQGGRFQ
ncbi:hypothetical protein MAR_003876, partial [Mya arenaria]